MTTKEANELIRTLRSDVSDLASEADADQARLARVALGLEECAELVSSAISVSIATEDRILGLEDEIAAIGGYSTEGEGENMAWNSGSKDTGKAPAWGNHNATAWPANKGTTFAAPCHHYGDSRFYVRMTDGRALSFAGARGDDLAVAAAPLVFDLAGAFTSASKGAFVSGKAPWLELNDCCIKPDVVRLDWADYGVPPCGFEFWRKLVSMIPCPAGEAPHAVFCCAGGHGRTGTALASVLLVTDAARTAEEAIAEVRKVHCAKAIETKGQEDYLVRLAEERDRVLGRAAPKSKPKLASKSNATNARTGKERVR